MADGTFTNSFTNRIRTELDWLIGLTKALALVSVLASVAQAQLGRYDSFVSGPRGPVAGANIAICSQPANLSTQPCSPLASLFSYGITSVTRGVSVALWHATHKARGDDCLSSSQFRL
jgi:hypothetical protein